jgi:UDP-N-acetylmuramate dehydrogenase
MISDQSNPSCAISLLSYNTFGIDACADHLVEVNTEGELREVLIECNSLGIQPLTLGGGSNILFSSARIPYVIVNKIKGKYHVNNLYQTVRKI